MSIPLICISLLAFLVIGLGFMVSLTRARVNRLAGSSNEPDDILYKRVRAHGNTTEYVPIIALLMYIISLSQYPAWVLWCMVLVTFSRYLLVAGILVPQTLAKPNPLRFIGALGTYVAGFGLCIALLLQALQT